MATSAATAAAAAAAATSLPYEWLWQYETLTLYPMVTLHQAIHQQLKAKLMHYQPHMNAVPMEYQQVKICSPVAAVYEDTPVAQVRAKVQWKVFRPQIDQLMTGTVIKASIDHLSLLVDDFNAIIARSRIPEDYEYRNDMEAYVYSGVPSMVLSVDTQITFKVVGMETRHGVLCIVGDMNSSGTG